MARVCQILGAWEDAQQPGSNSKAPGQPNRVSDAGRLASFCEGVLLLPPVQTPPQCTAAWLWLGPGTGLLTSRGDQVKWDRNLFFPFLSEEQFSVYGKGEQRLQRSWVICLAGNSVSLPGLGPYACLNEKIEDLLMPFVLLGGSR